MDLGAEPSTSTKYKTFREKTLRSNIFDLTSWNLKKYGGDTDFDIVAKEYCLPGLDTAD